MIFEYKPSGVCSRFYTFDIEDNVIKDVVIVGGCQGNLSGISRMITGMNIDFVIEKFLGTTCGPKSTSCPDQIARALMAYKKEQQNA